MKIASSTVTSSRSALGFTIVELLIVIVVIGILVAISIVAYTGITQTAQASAAKSALVQANKNLGLYIVDNSAFPADQATFNTLMNTSNNDTTVYQYSVDNSSDPKTYCVTATNGSTSYKVDSVNTTPTSGACSGHVLGGVTMITNLVGNPSLTTSSTGWTTSGDYSAGTRTQVSGEWVFTATRTGTAAAVVQCSTGPCLATTVSGNTYTASATVTSSVGGSFTLRIRRGGTTTILLTGPSTTLSPNVPQRLTVSGVLNDTSVYVAVYSISGSVGNTITVDKIMLTQGSTVYNYADGDTPTWIWNGAASASTSTGPAI